jgi:DNA-binding MarR family transcriptional regulator
MLTAGSTNCFVKTHLLDNDYEELARFRDATRKFLRFSKQLQHDDYEALARFRYAMRKFLRFSKTALEAEAALTPEQYEALLALKAFGSSTGLNIGELSERLQVKHHTAVSLVVRLVARKLIARKPGARDRRQVNLKLTVAGDSLLARVAAIHRQEIRTRSAEMIDALVRLRE